MILTELANTGIVIPEVGIGTWDYHAGPEPLRKGLDAGALFIDTAESYGTESAVGEAIHGIRDRVFIATKVSPQNFRPLTCVVPSMPACSAYRCHRSAPAS